VPCSLVRSQSPRHGRRAAARGAQEKKNENGGISGRWPVNQVGRYLSVFLLIFIIFLMAFLCVSQQGEFKNTKKNFLGKVYVKNFWPKKLGKKNFFPSVFSHRIFFYRVLAVSLHEEPKNTTKIFSKIRPENLKKTQKKVGR
jgi:hypothetical protein